MARSAFIKAAVVAAAMFAGPAFADDVATCAEDRAPPDQRIEACTRWIQSRPSGRSARAVAHSNRGFAFLLKKDYDRAIADFGQAIAADPRDSRALRDRAEALRHKGEHERAIADADAAIRLDARDAVAFEVRGHVWQDEGDYARAVADYSDAIRLQPDYVAALIGRCTSFRHLRDHDRAVADCDAAVRIDPRNGRAFSARAIVHRARGDLDRAIADADEAVRLSPRLAFAYNTRGNALKDTGNLDAARADFGGAIQADPTWVWGYVNRGILNAEMKDFAAARADFHAALALTPTDADGRNGVEVARTRLAALSADASAPSLATVRPAAAPPPEFPSKPVAAAPPVTSPAERPSKPVASPPSVATPALTGAVPPPPALDRRVALVIGNSKYTSVPLLPNPQRDAEAVAEALRRDGFQTVVLRSDLGRDAMREALRTFRDAADAADWGLIYYAGHGLQIGRTNYLIPVDARLRDERDVEAEAVSYGELEKAVGGAKGLRVIILDACRVDPFEAQMARANSTRAVARGLSPPPESDAGMLVVYSAKDGQVAEDGDGANSPFAAALVAQLKVPGREVRRVFDYVREEVMNATGRRQQPFTYGSLPGSRDFYFVAGK